MGEAIRSDDSPSFADQLATWIAHLAHHLPAQAPLADFVHHNTLHGYQHLPFTEALRAAQQDTGASPYWPTAHFKALLAAGRITSDDLAAALQENSTADLDELILPGLTRRAIQEASLRAGCDPIDPSQRAWRSRESAAVDALLADHFDRLLAPSEAPADWASAVQARWQQRWAALGERELPSQILGALTGTDPWAPFQTLLQRQWAAWLDFGLAAWPVPGGETDFFTFWREAAHHDLAWELEDLPAIRELLLDLPADPVNALADLLPRLHPDTRRWPNLIHQLATRRPGWAGMFQRLAQTGTHPRGRPIDLRDFLAVSAVVEVVVSEERCRQLTGSPTPLPDMAAWCQSRPAEMRVREALTAGRLAEHLQHRTHALCARALTQLVSDVEWQTLAEALVANEPPPNRAAEQLAALCAALDLAPDRCLSLTTEQAQALLAAALPADPLVHGALWLAAYERHYRDSLLGALAANLARPHAHRVRDVTAQVVFCMDDREEGTRRHLEECAPDVQTFGAAGFFGVAMYWQGLDDQVPTALCPVVVTPVHHVAETARVGMAGAAQRRQRRRNTRQRWRENLQQWTRLSPGTGTILATAGAPLALAALVARSLLPGGFGEGLNRWHRQFEPEVATDLTLNGVVPPGAPAPGFTDAEQVDRVANFLRTLGLTKDFAPLIVLLGHGSNSLNNPHQSAYDCGACAGRHGGPNARVFAAMANRPAVREGLAAQGIIVPGGTWFLAGEHNTCDERIAWYDLDRVPAALNGSVDRLISQLAEACRAHAVERCRRLASAPTRPTPWQALAHVLGRRHDLSQARPELGHATNAAAVIGRRTLTRGLFLDRRVFLISYDPSTDADGKIVESILLAAGPVGAGINLEYYFSTVDNERFGCGSKVTHNLTGRFGVMAGAESDLRTGLPLQMVEIHEPMRLLVVVEQTPETLSRILARQPALRELVENAWIHLVAQSPNPDTSTVTHVRYRPGQGWQPWQGSTVLPQVARSADWFTGETEALPPALLLGGSS